MKKALLRLTILVLLLMMFVSCDTTYDTLTQQISAEYANDAEREPSAEITSEIAANSNDTRYNTQIQQEMMEYADELEREPDIETTYEIAKEIADTSYITQLQQEPAECAIESEGALGLEIARGIAIEGVITGEVYFNEIAVSRLFVEPVFDVLGLPWGEHDNFFFFDGGLEISIPLIFGEEPHQGKASSMNVFAPNLNKLGINEITFDINRASLIAELGTPIQYYRNHDVAYSVHGNANVISYIVLSQYVVYELGFSFKIDDSSKINSIQLIKTSW